MSKIPTQSEIESQMRNAPRLAPSGQPLSNSTTPKGSGSGTDSGPGRAAARDGGPGVPPSGGTAEHIGGHSDRPARMPALPPHDPSKR